MKKNASIDEARRLRSSGDWTAAVNLLLSNYKKRPSPETACELGTYLCYLGQEETALEWFEKSFGSKNQDALWMILYEHFYCRKLLAIKKEVSDPSADKLLKRLDECKPSGYKLNSIGVSVSACLIVKNEERFLRTCLESLNGIVDEIIVVDTGSEDNTEQIAKEFGARLGRFDWIEDFSAARNHAIELASGNWILWIDADENLDAHSLKSIENAIVRPHLGGFNIEIRNYISETESEDILSHWPCRLFRNLPGVRFEGRIHEQISPSLRKSGFPIATLDGARIHHYGYRKDVMSEKNKHERTITMLKREVAENPDDSFQLFNLGNAYYVADDWENAQKWLSACLGGIPQHADYGQLAYQSLAFCHLFQKNPDLAMQTCANAEMAGFGGQLIEYVKAFVHRECGRFEEALSAVRTCQKLSLKPNETGDRSIFEYKAKYLEAEIAFSMNDYSFAEQLAREINTSTPGFMPAWLLRIESLRKQNKPTMETAKIAWTENRNRREFWQLWVNECEKMNDAHAVANAFVEATEFLDADDNFLINAGRAMSNIGDNKLALQCFEDAISLNPTNANAYLNLGDLLAKNGNHPDACAAYSGAIMLEQNNAQAWFVLGNSLYYSGNTNDAVLALQQAIKIDPTHQEARSNLELINKECEELAS